MHHRDIVDSPVDNTVKALTVLTNSACYYVLFVYSIADF